ncbi:hybrid sensor histidine kinase/response regulator [Aliterella atlantica]|uniref:histidine kinase n=1 Tax=Aliterella atlantica CENA595 TaxID=1618023 RepID=A0A0D8ZV65_9CYAN|nr:hybrid sensor histidine kinase/response regulator [Aliterella atlantica]KJH72257.1 hypothetical protein UH38_07420 [Aliterella atlantica CENA595]
MTSIYDETRNLFLLEAPELLENIERDLLNLKEDRSPAKVHNLMRMTHTLKGAAACVGLETIKTVAHSLEDAFKALYNPDVVIDPELESLLFQGYECLRLPLTAEFTDTPIDEAEVLNRAAGVFTSLQGKLGDLFDNQAQIPSSAELGFDITQSIFETGVSKRLKDLAAALEHSQTAEIASLLQEQATVFVGLAESLKLPGFGAIASTILQALQVRPNEVISIAQIALADLEAAQAVILAGDRDRGGEPSAALQALAANDNQQDLDLPDLSLLEQLGDDLESQLPNSLEETEFALELNDTWDFSPESMEQVFGSLPLETAPEVAANSEVNLPTLNSTSERPKEQATPNPTVRVEQLKLARLNQLSGELLTNQNHQFAADEQIQATIQKLQQQLSQHQKVLTQLRDWSDMLTIEMEQPVATDTERLHNLQQSFTSEFQQLLNSAWDDTIQMEETLEETGLFSSKSSQILEKQQRLLTSVRDDLLSAQMSPLGEIFSRFERVLQQLSSVHGKQAQLEISGTEVLIDKAIAQKLYDPILHLVRNAYDHGIESAQQRLQLGKSEQGQICIQAYQQERWTVIAVSDDGKGLDFEKIGERALEVNLIAPEQAESLTEEKLIDLLFTPGFSTVAQVSDLSGRGVGLDVVRSQIESLQGQISVRSQPQQGTTFYLQIPVSLKIAKVLTVQVGDRAYGFVAEAIERILLPQPEQINQWQSGQRVMQWQEDEQQYSVPVYKLSHIVQHSSLAKASQQPSPLLLIQHQEEVIGIEVDRVIGEQELVIRPVGEIINPPSYVLGCCILADGSLTLMLDSTELITQLPKQKGIDSEPTKAILPAPVGNTESIGTAQILVVDDSVTVRQNLAAVLQKAGYQVWQAKDGTEAIATLEQYPKIKLIISDVEMPGMNGFKFLSHRSAHPAWQKIPVIMLTSRSSEKYQQIAFELGANGYLTKPYLDREILNAVTNAIAA